MIQLVLLLLIIILIILIIYNIIIIGKDIGTGTLSCDPFGFIIINNNTNNNIRKGKIMVLDHYHVI